MTKRAYQVTTEDGKTRFGERELDFTSVEGVAPGGVFDVAALGDGAVAIVSFEPGFDCEFHHTPAPTWMLFMQGQMELEVSDGEKRVLGPGDIIYMLDSDGDGHRSRVVGDEAVVMATAGYAA